MIDRFYTSKKEAYELELLKEVFKKTPPSGGSAVNKQTKTKTIEKYDAMGDLIEKIIIREEG